MKQGYVPGEPKSWQSSAPPPQPMGQQTTASTPRQLPPQPLYQPAQQVPYQQQVRPQPQAAKRSILVLIAAVLGAAYSVYLIVYFLGIKSSDNMNGALGEIAYAIVLRAVTPHIVCVVLATIASAAAWYMRNVIVTGVAALLFLSSILMFSTYWLFVMPSLLLLCAALYAMLSMNSQKVRS